MAAPFGLCLTDQRDATARERTRCGRAPDRFLTGVARQNRSVKQNLERLPDSRALLDDVRQFVPEQMRVRAGGASDRDLGATRVRGCREALGGLGRVPVDRSKLCRRVVDEDLGEVWMHAARSVLGDASGGRAVHARESQRLGDHGLV